MKLSRLRPGSGLGLGFGAFFASFLPLSLLPMDASVPQKGCGAKEGIHGDVDPLDSLSGTYYHRRKLFCLSAFMVRFLCTA